MKIRGLSAKNVAVLAQCAVVMGLISIGCGAAGSGEPDDGSSNGKATGGGEGGDGDGPEPDPCDNSILIVPLSVDVAHGGQDDACRVQVVATDEAGETELDCTLASGECQCTPGGPVRDGMTLFVKDGKTVLFQQTLQPRTLACADWVSYGRYELDYIDLLSDAVDELRASIDSSASPEGCDNDSDCEAVALGSKPCGGPWSHVVVSKNAESYDDVVSDAMELERLEEIENQLNDGVSDCAYEVAPDVSCEAGVCVATSPK